MTSASPSSTDTAPPPYASPTPDQNPEDITIETKPRHLVFGASSYGRGCCITHSLLCLVFLIWLAAFIAVTVLWEANEKANEKVAWKYYKAHVPEAEFHGFEVTKHFINTHKPPVADKKLDKVLNALMDSVPWLILPLVILAGIGLGAGAKLRERWFKGDGEGKRGDEEEGIELEDWTGRKTTQPKDNHPRASESTSASSSCSVRKGDQDIGIVFPLSSLKYDKDAVALDDVKSDGLGVDTDISVREGQWSDVEGDLGVGLEAPQPVRLV